VTDRVGKNQVSQNRLVEGYRAVLHKTLQILLKPAVSELRTENLVLTEKQKNTEVAVRIRDGLGKAPEILSIGFCVRVQSGRLWTAGILTLRRSEISKQSAFLQSAFSLNDFDQVRWLNAEC
jgi:hypothetical protein